MKLHDAIEQLYVAFFTVNRPKRIICESYGLSEGELKQLLTYPLRELRSPILCSYLFDAVYNVGVWDDFRFFLPRLLETFTIEEIDLSSIAERIKYGQDKRFPLSQSQKTALKDFAKSYWDDILYKEPMYGLMILSLGTLGPFGVQRDELLYIWRNHPNRALILAFAAQYNNTVPPEWDRTELVGWLEEAFFTTTNEEVATLLSNAVIYLEAAESKFDA